MFGKSKLKAQIKELSMKAAYLERALSVRVKVYGEEAEQERIVQALRNRQRFIP